jgi:transglutaminase-like putative cysteine protease
VVVAAALNLGVSFGMMLAPYTVVAIFALSLFYLHRENCRFGPVEEQKPARRAKSKAANNASGGAKTGGAVGSARAAGDPSTWPKLAREQATLLGVLDYRPPAAPARRQQGQLEVLLGKRLLRQIGGLAAATGFFTIVVFFATPRQSDAVWRGPASRTQAMVGFSKEVSLGKMRDVLQDDAVAMRVSLMYADTGMPYEPVREPYFRGAVLSEYSSRRGEGKWSRIGELTKNHLDRRDDRKYWGDVVRQEYWLEPRGDAESLFAIYPALRIDGQTPDGILVDKRRQQVFRDRDDDNAGRTQFNYVLEAAAFDDRWQRAVTVRDEFDRGDLSSQIGRFDPSRFPQLKELAEKILKEEGIDPTNHMRTAYALEGYFRDASKFTYSLDLSKVQQTPGLDPIVDFAVNHRTGHCQYFASAVALMLRTLGIPSRLVIGYKGGEFNALANHYLVRERHAHAWVEVFLPEAELTEDMVPVGIPKSTGAWLRIDPTPGEASDNQLSGKKSVFSRAGDVLDYARVLWADYVLGLNSKRQQESIYKPLSTRLGDALTKAIDSAGWKDALVAAFDRLGIDVRGVFRGRWFDWRASLAAIVLCLAGFAALRASVAYWPRLGSWFARRQSSAPARRAPVIEFYRRLEALLARAQLKRHTGQTQREFARVAGELLRDRAAAAEAASAPLLVVEAFYRVRFGGSELSREEADRVERSLAALEAALAPAK